MVIFAALFPRQGIIEVLAVPSGLTMTHIHYLVVTHFASTFVPFPGLLYGTCTVCLLLVQNLRGEVTRAAQRLRHVQSPCMAPRCSRAAQYD